MNRYKLRLSAMYPEYSEAGIFDISRIRSASMIEVVSFLDTPTQLNLKCVNRYFRKLVKISHNRVSLDTSSGWIDAIHLSTFLKEITLVGEPKEKDLKEFTTLLRNDGYLQLSHLFLHLIGEWALIEILDALSARIQRDCSMGILGDSFRAELVIQENEFSPYFAMRFSNYCNTVLYRVLTNLTFIVNDPEGVEAILKYTQFWKCSKLVEFDISNVHLTQEGYLYFLNSFWPMHEEISASPITQLLLRNTQLTDWSVIGIANSAERGLLSNLCILDVSENRLSCEGIHVLTKPLSEFLCPNIRAISFSNNTGAGCGSLTSWLLQLAEGVCPLLSVLELNACGLTMLEMDALCVYIGCPFADSMTVLDIGNNPEIAEGIPQLFQELYRSTNQSFTSLNFEGLNLTSSLLTELCEWMKQEKARHLRKLILRVNVISESGLCKLLAALQQSSILKLNLLDISSNLIGSFQSTWKDLFSLPFRQTSLSIEECDMSHNPITDQDMYLLMKFFRRYIDMSRLMRFSMEDMKLSAKGVSYLFSSFPFEFVCQLHRLNIVSIPITGVGQSLHTWLSSPAASSLRRLILVNCSLDSDDLLLLNNAFKTSSYCQGLQCLRLSGNRHVDDLFVTEFLTIYKMDGVLPLLCELDLSYTEITKTGASAFLDFFAETSDYSLRILNLAYMQIPESRVEAIHNEFRRIFRGHCLM